MIEAVLKKYSTEGARRDADEAKMKSGGGGDSQDEKSNLSLQNILFMAPRIKIVANIKPTLK